ncbi:MAG: CAAD domain-containing protein, partial [Synechococcaceae cyanobacterium]
PVPSPKQCRRQRPRSPSPPPASPPEGVVSTITVPPLGQGAKGDGEGGEFDLLLQRVSQWLKEQDLPARWERLQGPLRGLALLLLAVAVLRVYGSLIDTLDGLPLVPRLFQLVGLIVLVKFSLLNLVRTSDRERLISDWSQRWAAFRGRV